MSDRASYKKAWPLLAAVFLLLAGQGLLWTLVPLSASTNGFPQSVIGIIGSAYHAGMAVGCLCVPIIIATVGHLRAFAAFSTTAAIAILALPFLAAPWCWVVLIVVVGFVIIGLDATSESWFHDLASNVTRGLLTSAYQVTRYVGRAVGPWIVLLAPSVAIPLFLAVSAAFLLAMLPLAVARPTLPNRPSAGSRTNPAWLYRVAPVAAIGCLVAGATSGTMTILTPIFARQSGLDDDGVVVLVTAVWFGAAAGNWLAGYFGDRWGDRRIVLAFLLLVAIPCQAALVTLPINCLAITVFLLAAISGATYALYQLSSSHGVDLVGSEHAVAISSAALLTYTLGAIGALILAGALMDSFSPSALFAQNAGVHAVLLLFVARDIWRTPMQEGPLATER